MGVAAAMEPPPPAEDEGATGRTVDVDVEGTEEATTVAALAPSVLSQRRKKLVKLLKADWPEPNIVHALEALKVPADVRGEKLSLEQFVELTNLLSA